VKRLLLSALAVFVLGLAIGAGGFTFYYGEGGSYLSADPKACVNCHIMRPQYDSWLKSSHQNVAGCVDCHLPHDFIGKYLAKAESGYLHSKGFTLQDFPEPIMIKAKSSRILQKSCLHCHQGLVHHITARDQRDSEQFTCVHCHADVGHGEPLGMGVLAEYPGRKGLEQLKQKLAREENQ
jgi:cytochrome c nitrite reductase small subunit